MSKSRIVSIRLKKKEVITYARTKGSALSGSDPMKYRYFELERGNVDGFAKLLDYHWELSKKIDAGSSNTLIEQIFSSIEELVDGKLVCGAGGGGFLQVILKKGVTRQMVEERLKEVFMDSLVGVADCKLVWE